MGETLEDLIPGYSFLVKELGVDEFGVRVSYEIRPPVPTSAAPGLGWWLSGLNEAGEEYDDGGGAVGLSSDGTFTDGMWSLQPPPPASDTFIDLLFGGDRMEGAPRVVRVELPKGTAAQPRTTPTSRRASL